MELKLPNTVVVVKKISEVVNNQAQEQKKNIERENYI